MDSGNLFWENKNQAFILFLFPVLPLISPHQLPFAEDMTLHCFKQFFFLTPAFRSSSASKKALLVILISIFFPPVAVVSD